MANKIGSLQLDIGANIAKLQKDMGKVEKTVNKSSKAMVQSANYVKNAFAGLFTGYMLKRAISFGERLIDDADAMSKLAQKTGVTVETLSAMGHAAELSGANIGTLSKAFKTLAKNSNDTADGVGEAKDAFNELGISVMEEDGSLKSLDTIMLEVADSISKMTDETKQAAFASDIFGRSGFELLPMLKQGKEGIMEMTEEADKLGITIGEDFAKDAVKLNDSVTNMTKAFDGLARAGMEGIAEDLTDFAVAMTDVITSLGKFAQSDAGKFLGWVNKLANPLSLVATAYKKVKDLVSDEEEGNPFDEFEDFDATSFEKAGKEVVTTIKEVDNAWSEFDGFDDQAFEKAGEDIKTTVDEIAEANEGAVAKVGLAVNSMTNAVSMFAAGAKISVKDMAASILQDILRLQATKFFTSVFTPIFGADVSTSVPQLATGGVAMASTFANIGEGADPEAVLPLARVGGKLGVRSAGGDGGKMIVNIKNNSSADLQVSKNQSAMGDELEVMIVDTVVNAGYNGQLNTMMKGVFNVSSEGVKR